MFRFEYKYKITSFERDRLVQAILPFMELDRFALPGNSYEVRTVYFDSYFGNAYYEKDDGLPYRVKIRIRYYPGIQRSEHAFIELKKKHGHKNKKTRIKIPVIDAFNIVDPMTPEAEAFYRSLSYPFDTNVMVSGSSFLINLFHLTNLVIQFKKKEIGDIKN